MEVIPIDSEYMISMRFKQSNLCSHDDIIVAFVYLPPEGSDCSNPHSILEQEILPLSVLYGRPKYARTGTSAEFNNFDLSRTTAY